MTTEPTKQELEKLVEAQARGETIKNVETEEEISAEALLDRRVSKDAFTFVDPSSPLDPHTCKGVG